MTCRGALVVLLFAGCGSDSDLMTAPDGTMLGGDASVMVDAAMPRDAAVPSEDLATMDLASNDVAAVDALAADATMLSDQSMLPDQTISPDQATPPDLATPPDAAVADLRPSPCNSFNCNGCCYNNVCQFGVSDQLCGKKGQACMDCTAILQVCLNGFCTP